MKEQMILKTELLSRLNQIYNQLEELENVLHSSFQYQQGKVQMIQKNQIKLCETKIAELEEEFQPAVDENRKIEVKEVKDIKQTASIKFELGF